MKIEHINYFLAMKDSSSLSEASEKAHISQQGYGKVIAALEEALGCRLVDRDAKGARLTNSGALFMHYAETIVDALEKAKVGLKTQNDDLNALRAFDGNIAFSDICMNTFDPIFSSRGLLNQAGKDELSLSEALERADSRDWICLCDVCAQVYPDYTEKWDIETLATGRVGVVAPKVLLERTGLSSAEDVIAGAPLAVFNCQVTREIYNLLFGSRNFGDIKMRTTKDELLRDGLRRGDFAVLSDSFHWARIQAAMGTPAHSLVFIPFEKDVISLFGFVRKKGLTYSAEQRRVIDAMKRTFANLSKTAKTEIEG